MSTIRPESAADGVAEREPVAVSVSVVVRFNRRIKRTTRRRIPPHPIRLGRAADDRQPAATTRLSSQRRPIVGRDTSVTRSVRVTWSSTPSTPSSSPQMTHIPLEFHSFRPSETIRSIVTSTDDRRLLANRRPHRRLRRPNISPFHDIFR